MECAGSVTISAFGMMFFAGFSIGSIIFPTLSDKKGRKKLFLASLIVNLSCFLLMLVLPGGKSNYNMIYIFITCFFLQGLQSGARTATGYVYFNEIAPVRYGEYMGSAWNVSEATVYIIITLYYWHISRYWKWLFIFGSGMTTLCITLITCFIPESPKWLYEQGRYDEC